MPYTSPPTFADDNILSAAQLNILSDDIEFLYSNSQGVNLPILETELVLTGTNAAWRIRHKHQFLVFEIRYKIDAAWITEIEFTSWYGRNESLSTDPVYNKTYTTTGTNSVTVVIDLETGDSTVDAYTNVGHIEPTVGEFYQIECEAVRDGSAAGNSYFNILAIYESDTDPLA